MSAVGTTMTVVAALQALQQLLDSASRINMILQTAQLEGRKSLTEAEWLIIKERRDTALSRLDAAILAAEKNGGPAANPISSLPVAGGKGDAPAPPTTPVQNAQNAVKATVTPPLAPPPPKSEDL